MQYSRSCASSSLSVRSSYSHHPLSISNHDSGTIHGKLRQDGSVAGGGGEEAKGGDALADAVHELFSVAPFALEKSLVNPLPGREGFFAAAYPSFIIFLA